MVISLSYYVPSQVHNQRFPDIFPFAAIRTEYSIFQVLLPAWALHHPQRRLSFRKTVDRSFQARDLGLSEARQIAFGRPLKRNAPVHSEVTLALFCINKPLILPPLFTTSIYRSVKTFMPSMLKFFQVPPKSRYQSYTRGTHGRVACLSGCKERLCRTLTPDDSRRVAFVPVVGFGRVCKCLNLLQPYQTHLEIADFAPPQQCDSSLSQPEAKKLYSPNIWGWHLWYMLAENETTGFVFRLK